MVAVTLDVEADDGAGRWPRPRRAGTGPQIGGRSRRWISAPVQSVWRLSDDPDHGYVAASDSRRDGRAAFLWRRRNDNGAAFFPPFFFFFFFSQAVGRAPQVRRTV